MQHIMLSFAEGACHASAHNQRRRSWRLKDSKEDSRWAGAMNGMMSLGIVGFFKALVVIVAVIVAIVWLVRR